LEYKPGKDRVQTAFCILGLGTVLVYSGSCFVFSYYTRSGAIGIRKASVVFSVGFVLSILSVFWEGTLPGKLGQWTEGCLMTIICVASLAIGLRILIKSRTQ
jgi:hypothetical protein